MTTSDASTSNIPEMQSPKPVQDVETALREINGQEQLYSIALFDILGFSNFVEQNGNHTILGLYTRLLEIIHAQESSPDGAASRAGSVVPVPTSPNDWKSNALIADANGFVQVCHFSDTFIIYVNYLLQKQGWWLRDTMYEPYPLLWCDPNTPCNSIFLEKHALYLSFLQTCMEFFCQSIIAGIPLRGCISTGFAMMDPYKSIYFGSPLVEAARGEPAQNAIGFAFGKSFNVYHPVYNDYFIPYLGHMKLGDKRTDFLSPMVPDWPKYWRQHFRQEDYCFSDCISRMNSNPSFSSYYDNVLKFFEFSDKHTDWAKEIDRTDIRDINDYYDRVKRWYKAAD